MGGGGGCELGARRALSGTVVFEAPRSRLRSGRHILLYTNRTDPHFQKYRFEDRKGYWVCQVFG